MEEASGNSSQTQQYPARTRRWGRTTVVEEEAKPNLFLKYAPLFFYPFIREDYTHYHRLLNEDAYLVSRLIRTCGIFVYCCGEDMTVGYDMARTLLNFAWMVRFQMMGTTTTATAATTQSLKKRTTDNIALLPHHAANHHGNDQKGNDLIEQELKAATAVRQSVLTAVLQCFMSLRSELLMENYMDQMEEMIAWLVSVTEYDADEECREIAKTALQILRTKIQQDTPSSSAVM